MSVLVKQLTESDVNGAPLLFQAVSSRENDTCFKAVRDELSSTLGRVGLMEQVNAVDRSFMGIMMYAARSNHINVFRDVGSMLKDQRKRALLEELRMNRNEWMEYRQEKITGEGPVGDAIETEWKNESQHQLEEVWKKQVARQDAMGRTLLHHACEAGCVDILQEVVAMASEHKVFHRMKSPDKNERTPMMYILRNTHQDDETHVKAKIEVLWNQGGASDWMQEREVSRPPDLVQKMYGKTELMHAARGGPITLRLALSKIRLANGDGSTDGGVQVNNSLGINTRLHNGAEEVHRTGYDEYFDTMAWGHGMLLAAAARGGHVTVLNCVLKAIKVS